MKNIEKHGKTVENVEKHGKTGRIGESIEKHEETRDNVGKTGECKRIQGIFYIGQHFFNTINAVPREIHTPPGSKKGMPWHPLKCINNSKGY